MVRKIFKNDAVEIKKIYEEINMQVSLLASMGQDSAASTLLDVMHCLADAVRKLES